MTVSIGRLTRDPDCSALEIAFLHAFSPSKPGYFHVKKGEYPGMHDGSEGVQWNIFHDHNEGRVTLGVNLEGETYDGWPIARLITRELRRVTLPSVAASVAAQLKPGADVRILLWRDTWIKERSKKGDGDREYDHSAKDLTPDRWRRALLEAVTWLADTDGGRRTLPPPKEHLSTSPHFQATTTLWLTMPSGPDGHAERVARLSAGRSRLERIHEWAARRSAK